jgi:hypothetical protein
MRTCVLLVATAVLTAACGQLSSPSIPLDAGVTVHADPTGDAGTAPTFDVVELRSTRGTSELQIRVWTVPDPVLPAPGAFASAAQFSGGIGFNTDLNNATGLALVPPCGGGQGLERFIDLTARNANGTYNVLDGTLSAVGAATASQDGPRVTFTVTFAALGTVTGRTEVNAVIGVGAFPFIGKDCAPDSGQMVPTRERTRLHPVIW